MTEPYLAVQVLTERQHQYTQSGLAVQAMYYIQSLEKSTALAPWLAGQHRPKASKKKKTCEAALFFLVPTSYLTLCQGVG